MSRISIKELKEMATKVSDEMLDKAFLKGGLKLTDEQISTLEFVFGLCYMAERDLGDVLAKPWEVLPEKYPPEVLRRAKEVINDFLNKQINKTQELEAALAGIGIENANQIRRVIKGRYNKKPLMNIDYLFTFGEKIFYYEQMYFENNVVIVLRKIKAIRNNLSHVKIDELTYDGESLMLRKTKEKILGDYFDAVSNADVSKSNFNDNVEFTNDEDPRVIEILKQL